MKDLLNFIVTSLVTKPEAISIDEQIEDGIVNLNLTVDPSDMGIIIGKSGQTIRAIRKLLTVRAIAENIRVNLQLAEPPSQEIASSAEDSASSQ
ncbi:MAG: KH domain-containing protein [Candidatus Daviesbacteria bacterium]|nr:KH domain-containing protein [Candidatus Daviesbacteria bacterium]